MALWAGAEVTPQAASVQLDAVAVGVAAMFCLKNRETVRFLYDFYVTRRRTFLAGPMSSIVTVRRVFFFLGEESLSSSCTKENVLKHYNFLLIYKDYLHKLVTAVANIFQTHKHFGLVLLHLFHWSKTISVNIPWKILTCTLSSGSLRGFFFSPLLVRSLRAPSKQRWEKKKNS